ncbi:hypothetical protein [Microbacterium sp. NPDC056234]|uniref:hypothetical protein n=1 Tax=Microbacterium sp. NPDC056234 TaxID=3345757 RepID=UPI0035D623AC
MSTPPMPSILIRTTSWFVLAAAGNVAIIGIIFILNTTPISVPASASLEVVASFALPMYSPELLIFTSIPGLLSALRVNGASDSERDEAVRLIAWAVRVALTFVLAFAVVVVVAAPDQLATVLFAALLGFITFVLAERLDPPIPAPIEQRYLKADQDLAVREIWANEALGQRWHQNTTRWPWLIVAAFIIAPVILQTALGVAIGSMLWGADFGLSAKWAVVPAVTAYGSIILTFAWLSTADKADSPQARAWRGRAFSVLAVLTSVAFASAFLFSGTDSVLVGVLILGITALQSAALWAPVDWKGRQMLSRVAATITSRHLERTTRAYAPIYLAWDEHSGEAEVSPTWIRRLFHGRA